MSRPNLSLLLFVVSIMFVALALVTLLPFPSSTPSDLGYHALCPFVPWSPLILLLIAGVAWAVRQHINAQPK
jgi:NADH:ubiquinone oxidoreductase subunit 3 (subunit A)